MYQQCFSDAKEMFSSAVDSAAAKLRDSDVVYMIEGTQEASDAISQSIIIRGGELDFNTDLSAVQLSGNSFNESDAKALPCSHFCLKNKPILQLSATEVNRFSSRSNGSCIMFFFLFLVGTPKWILVLF